MKSRAFQGPKIRKNFAARRKKDPWERRNYKCLEERNLGERLELIRRK